MATVLRRAGSGFCQAVVRTQARILVRLDGGFAAPEIFTFLEEQRCKYVVAMAKNSVLKRHAQMLMARVRVLSEAPTC